MANELYLSPQRGSNWLPWPACLPSQPDCLTNPMLGALFLLLLPALVTLHFRCTLCSTWVMWLSQTNDRCWHWRVETCNRHDDVGFTSCKISWKMKIVCQSLSQLAPLPLALCKSVQQSVSQSVNRSARLSALKVAGVALKNEATFCAQRKHMENNNNNNKERKASEATRQP